MVTKYFLAAIVGALVLPVTTLLSDYFDFVGGAFVAVPFLDLLAILFITARRDAENMLVGDMMGQIGAFSAVFVSFALLQKTELSPAVIVGIGLATAILMNVIASVLLVYFV
jgi:hypothetical protein